MRSQFLILGLAVLTMVATVRAEESEKAKADAAAKTQAEAAKADVASKAKADTTANAAPVDDVKIISAGEMQALVKETVLHLKTCKALKSIKVMRPFEILNKTSEHIDKEIIRTALTEALAKKYKLSVNQPQKRNEASEEAPAVAAAPASAPSEVAPDIETTSGHTKLPSFNVALSSISMTKNGKYSADYKLRLDLVDTADDSTCWSEGHLVKGD